MRLLATIFLIPVYAVACNCPELQPISKETCNKYDIIFKGTVDSVSTCKSDIAKVFFTIEQLFNGKATQKTAISYDCSSDCQMSFATGETWLIYGMFYKYGEYQVNLCSRSRKAFSDEEKDIYTATNGLEFKDEVSYLENNFNTRSFSAENNPMYHHNTQPGGITKIVLIISSFLFLGLLYFLTKKKVN